MAAWAKRSLSRFIRYGWQVLEATELDWNWHVEYIADHVQAVLEDWIRVQRDREYAQRARRLLINVPPGTAKSRIVSVYAPAWMWLHWPSWRVLCLSANPGVALRDADYSRQLVSSDWYRSWFGTTWQIRDDLDAKSNYGNTAGGQRISKGITAKITGERFDCLLVDDPNDLKEIHSEAIRTSVNESWDSAIANRVNDRRTSVYIGIMQRGHEDDWSGHVLRKGGWEHVCLPLERETGPVCPCASCARGETFIGKCDPRSPGEILHPDRFPPDVIEEERVTLGSYGYAGQMQQRPTPKEGGLFRRDHWRFWKPDGVGAVTQFPRPEGCWNGPSVSLPSGMDVQIISLDAAFKGGDTSDNVCFLVIGSWRANRYILDRRWGKLTFKQTVDTLRDLARRWPRAHKKLIEDKANGPAIIDTLQGEIQGIIPVNPEGGKESRAAAVQPQVESGNVYLPDGAPWLDDFVGELASFPNGSHDDQVDALSQALLYLSTDLEVARARALAAM